MIFLRDELDINRMILKGARGTGTATPTKKGVGQQMEKDVVTIVVPEERADEVFEAIYFEMGIDHPHGGFLFMGPLHFATLYELPELPAEED